MATFKHILNYYRRYRYISILSIAASSLFEIIDLVVPYAIGQILNVLSKQPVDGNIQSAIGGIAHLTGQTPNQYLALAVLLGIIFVVTVIRAPIQPWIGAWYHWEIALRARRDQTEKAIAKILMLPLDFYDQNNPGRIAGRVARGISNHTWTYPEVAGQLIPKLFRVLGIFILIWAIEWRIAVLFLISFVAILGLTFRKLKRLIEKEDVLDKHQENTESRTSEKRWVDRVRD
jgi:ATP-binding cassette, subfamily B, bacterial